MSIRCLYILVLVFVFALSGCEDIADTPEGDVKIQVEYNTDAEVATVLLTGEPGATFKALVLRNHEYVEDKSLLASMMIDVPIRSFDEHGKYELSLDSFAMLKSKSTAEDVQGYLLFSYCDESGLCEEIIVEPLFVNLPDDDSGSDQEPDEPTGQPETENPNVEPEPEPDNPVVEPEPDNPSAEPEQPSDNDDNTIEDYKKDPEIGSWA